MNYPKQPLSSTEHIIQLRQRGLVINNESKAENYLKTIGYYRLSAYFLPFIDRQRDKENHYFLLDTHFEQILKLYIFDRQLRLLVMEAIERIEVAVRTAWANELSMQTQDPHAYMQARYFKNLHKHQKNLDKVRQDIKNSTETFIIHYFDKYSSPDLPPIWAMVETLSFGALSHWYANTKDNKVKQRIAKAVGLPNVTVMEGVLQALTLVRNICAHHSRLWNRQFVKAIPNIKKLNPILLVDDFYTDKGQIQHQPSKKLYNYLVVLNHMMLSLQPNTKWKTRLINHLQNLSATQLASMGFPLNWRTCSFWGGEDE